MSWGDSSGQTPYDPNNPYAQQAYPQRPPQQPQNPSWGQQGGYPQPMPDQSGYGQVPQQQPLPQQQPYPYDAQSGGYQAPGYGQPAYGPPQYPNYAPPKKTNGALIATVVAAVLVAGGGITAAVMLTGKSNNPSLVANGQSSAGASSSASGSPSASPTGDSSTDDSSDSNSSLHIPSSVSGLTLLNNSDAKSAVSSTREELTESDLYPDPVVAAYNDDGDDEVTELFEAQAISQLGSSGKDEVSKFDPSSFVATMMKGSDITNAEDEDTSASDGALSCGSREVNDVDVVFCYWDDDTSFGGLEVFDSDSLDDAAATADEIRAAAEGD